MGNLHGGIPPVTKIQLIIIGAIGLLSYGEVLDKYNLYFNTEKIFLEGEVLFYLFLGMAPHNLPSMLQKSKPLLPRSALLLVHFNSSISGSISSSIERSSFKRGSIDFMYFLILMFLFIYFFAILLKINFLSNIFLFAMYYYYGRTHSNQMVIINLLPMRASFMIWYFCDLSRFILLL